MQFTHHYKVEKKKKLREVKNMNIAFAGFRHDHIFGLYNTVLSSDVVNLVGCFERDENAKKQAKERKNVEFNYNTYDELININTANIEVLQKLEGIGPTMAEKIIDYREENGHFSSIEDIKNVSGIGESKYNKIKDNITI